VRNVSCFVKVRTQTGGVWVQGAEGGYLDLRGGGVKCQGDGIKPCNTGRHNFVLLVR
jgi:hypothetical protein